MRHASSYHLISREFNNKDNTVWSIMLSFFCVQQSVYHNYLSHLSCEESFLSWRTSCKLVFKLASSYCYCTSHYICGLFSLPFQLISRHMMIFLGTNPSIFQNKISLWCRLCFSHVLRTLESNLLTAGHFMSNITSVITSFM